MIDEINNVQIGDKLRIDEENCINNIVYADDIMLMMKGKGGISKTQVKFPELLDIFQESLNLIKLELNLKKIK